MPAARLVARASAGVARLFYRLEIAGERPPAAERAAANAAMFRAAETALAAGDAIALFPEGISHLRPSLAPLKTGAARLALGAARELGAFPIVPVGITLDDRAIFRSTGLLVVGPPVGWADLAAAVAPGDGEPAPDLVRALTRRIDEALRAVTAGYASWDDARLVASAEAVHAAAREAARLQLPGATPLITPPPASAAPVTARLARYHLGAALLA
ncbi:MAG TPA: 1-acyl-sn-glycerol-3-phosphate acyltransferase, partial [Gemmatirosa sp.]